MIEDWWLGIAPVVIFCGWFIAFPASVKRFYVWFHHGHVHGLPGERGIRVIGICALVFLILIVLDAKYRVGR